MAISSSIDATASGKSSSHAFPTETVPNIIHGLVQHPALSPSDQVQILSVVDATGSASLGDIVAELPGHGQAVSAVLALVSAGVLAMDAGIVLDENTLISRTSQSNHGDGSDGGGLPPASRANIPVSLAVVAGSPFAPKIIVGSGEDRRDFCRGDELQRPGVYILLSETSGYVGVGGTVGQRIAGGQQPIENIETIIALVDDNNVLTVEDAKVAERILWSRLAATGEREMINGVPDGAVVDVQRYSELDAFVAQACLTLRHENLLFVGGSSRAVLAGPRGEPGRVGKIRPFNHLPAGDIFELNFGDGLVALAARQTDTKWVLLSGSDIRLTPVPSANCSTSFLRAGWLHAGLLDLAPDARSYMTQRDLAFSSGSAAAQFCSGAKGLGLSSWRPVDCGQDSDPDITPPLAA
ncbi:MAG: hypothetical protein ACO1O4_08840 [Devosia sp.]